MIDENGTLDLTNIFSFHNNRFKINQQIKKIIIGSTLKQIADKHQVSIANVAVNYILDKPAVGGVIVGARLGISEHLEDNAKVFGFTLDATDLNLIAAVSQQSQDLYQVIGDCGDEYRR